MNQTGKFYLTEFLKTQRYFIPVMILFLQLRSLNYTEIFILYAVESAVVFLMEIPSGILADRLGKLLHASQEKGGDLQPDQHLVAHANEAAGIFGFCREIAADLVILGTRGRMRIKAMLTGTTAEHVLRQGTCAVLAVKPKGFRYDLG